ncbi:unnamed protein product [Polarella glacialis]|uniref:Uncharacterized protein n=1 Tax=Polarella glacialis TaxID=89957 RepID=A0A813GCV2_POLGL|nr:unnamed protein product [Polarella glacialis]
MEDDEDEDDGGDDDEEEESNNSAESDVARPEAGARRSARLREASSDGITGLVAVIPQPQAPAHHRAAKKSKSEASAAAEPQKASSERVVAPKARSVSSSAQSFRQFQIFERQRAEQLRSQALQARRRQNAPASERQSRQDVGDGDGDAAGSDDEEMKQAMALSLTEFQASQESIIGSMA